MIKTVVINPYNIRRPSERRKSVKTYQRKSTYAGFMHNGYASLIKNINNFTEIQRLNANSVFDSFIRMQTENIFHIKYTFRNDKSKYSGHVIPDILPLR